MQGASQVMAVHSRENTPQPIADGTEVPAKRAHEALPKEDEQLHEDKKVLLEADLTYVKQLSKSKEVYQEDQAGSFQMGQASEQVARRKPRPSSGGKHIHRKPINLSEEAQNQQQERNERSLDDVQLVQNTSVEQNEPNLEIDLETVQPDQVENSKTGRKWRRIAVIGAVLAVGLGVLGKIVR
eukprot:TRINITY_DN1290_c0_g1_i1.p2 TRINITY_DN1290_c0_g1~~TRINITY_DN1290_c0_g1_i1.p2  ORF type:complete len:183 (+),score=36.30 TRINITY_DN1290_c0_g1_i1:190-738(+)